MDARAITDAEFDAFRRQGWCQLPGLVPPEDTRMLLEVARAIHAEACAREPRASGPLDGCWVNWDSPVFQARQITLSPYPELILCKAMGRAAARLIDRRRLTDAVVPIRSLGALLYCKTEAGTATGAKIQFHQDSPSYHADRAGLVTIWLALDEVTPEQGSMRFLTGSHREGSLGDHRGGFPADRYPKLLGTHEVSPPLHYAAGDATAHEGYTLHSSPANATDRPRWGLLCSYIAADVSFDDSFYAENPLGFPPPFEQYPVVYP